MVVGMMMTMMRRRRRCYFCFRGREKGVSMAWRRVVSCWAAGSPLSVVVGKFRYSWIDRSGAEVVDKMFVDNNNFLFAFEKRRFVCDSCMCMVGR